ncbi:MAG: hypothetical protein FWE40_03920 [Oscillospiraceae bacterium]|nr:hypothetical protein [Oscillospiraceae bacterium]
MDFAVEKIEKARKAAEILMQLHRDGALGGEIMPEDANPGLPKSAEENYLYFTLPMALNYQRNSYKLWEAANQTAQDAETADIFSPMAVVEMEIDVLREKLLKHKVALQPNRHPQIWLRLCQTFTEHFDGSVNKFFSAQGNSVLQIKDYMTANKKLFPYLSGAKIMNYWLYVMLQYTDAAFADREHITVAPDTHVIQATAKLGLISAEDMLNPNIRLVVSELWNAVFAGTDWHPIDIHTPLWLWSRSGFAAQLWHTNENNQ